MGEVMLISRREGEKIQYLDINSNNLTKEAVMALPKVEKDNCITWGGWIHAFWCLEGVLLAVRHGERRRQIYSLVRYDAYND